MPEFLFVFAHRHEEFRIAELRSVAEHLSLPIAFDAASPGAGVKPTSPFLFVDVPTAEDAMRLAKRLVLVLRVIDFWGHGDTMDECVRDAMTCDSDKVEPWCRKGMTYKFMVEGFGRKYPMDEKREFMSCFSGVRLPSKVNLKQPDSVLWIMTDIGHPPTSGLERTNEPPRHFYFGREIYTGDRGQRINRILLSNRRYLGTTSTDAELTLLYANMAQVGPGDLVWDPCCGTASILVGCSTLGALVLGSDIDFKAIKGKGEECTISSNFDQYSLSSNLIEAFPMDLTHCGLRADLRFDAIVTDPPYGVREGTRSVHVDEEKEAAREYAERGMHAVQTQNSTVGAVLKALLEESALRLKMGGRLVFLFPCINHHTMGGEFDESYLPSHPCMRLITTSEQVLTTKWSRRLVTMEKVAEPEPGHSAKISEGYDLRRLVMPYSS